MVRNFDSAPISIKSVANRTFASDSAWKGWTDQGPENDMRIFRKEELRVKQFAFEILPEGGPQCLALSKRFPGFAQTADLIVCQKQFQRNRGFLEGFGILIEREVLRKE